MITVSNHSISTPQKTNYQLKCLANKQEHAICIAPAATPFGAPTAAPAFESQPAPPPSACGSIFEAPVPSATMGFVPAAPFGYSSYIWKSRSCSCFWSTQLIVFPLADSGASTGGMLEQLQ